MNENTPDNDSYWTEDEIDLRELVKTLSHWWWLFVATTAIAAIVAFTVGSMKPIQYEAKVIVLNHSSLSSSSISSMATSNALVQQLFDTLDPKPQGVNSYEALSKLLAVKLPRATSAKAMPPLTLTARASTGAEAAHIVNVWAQLLANAAKDLELSTKKEDLTVVQKQYDQAQISLTKAKDALVTFQGKNRVALLSNKLNSLKSLQTSYLAQQRRLTLLAQDTAFLQKQFSYRQGGKATIGDDLAVLALLLKSVDSQSVFQVQASDTSSAFSGNNLDLQISDKSSLFPGDNLDGRIRFLENMRKDLQSRLNELNSNVTSLDAQILSLQKELQAAQDLQDQLLRSKQIALANYDSFVSQREKLAREVQSPTGHVIVAGQAVPPSLPLSRRRLTNTLLAGIVGLMIGMGGAFIIEWWQKDTTEMDTGEKEVSGRSRF